MQDINDAKANISVGVILGETTTNHSEQCEVENMALRLSGPEVEMADIWTS